MSEFELPVPLVPGNDSPAVDIPTNESVPAAEATTAPVAVNPARSAAGRRGAERVHKLAELGKEYEREHGLTPGRQRLRQLIQLGKRYEVEHGLRIPKARPKRRGDAWVEFLSALVRVVKPAYRQAVERLVRTLAEDDSQPSAAA